MSDALEEHDEKVSIGGRNITNLQFADDIDALAEEEQELEALVESLDKSCRRYKMEISVEKTKTDDKQHQWHPERDKGKWAEAGYCNKLQVPWISCFRLRLHTRDSLKDCTSKLKPIWRDNNIFLGSKVKLMRSLVISILLYACESWTLTTELEVSPFDS